MVIYYVDGVAGSRKTTHALEFAAQASVGLNANIFFAQPTTELIKQSIALLNEKWPGCEVREFDSETFPGRVYGELAKFMVSWGKERKGGCIVFVTHKCLFELETIPNKQYWHLIVDEIPKVDFEYHPNVPDTYQDMILPNFETVECGVNTMFQLLPRGGLVSTVKALGKNRRKDDVVAVLQDIFRDVANPHTTTHISRQSWSLLGQNGRGQLDIHGWYKATVFEGWKTVSVMGAHFTQSLLYYLWSQGGIEFRLDHRINVTKSEHDTTVGDRVNIYCFAERPWSKYARNKIAAKGDMFHFLKPLITDVFENRQYLMVANTDIEDGYLLENFSDGIRIPNMPHGLNKFRHINDIVFLSALNNTPQHFTYLEKIHFIAPEHLRQARYFQYAYQAIMRTSLREPTSTEKVRIIVPDMELGNWLAEMFPGSKLHSLPVPESCKAVVGDSRKARGRPKTELAQTVNERVQRHRAKQAELGVTKNTLYNKLFVSGEIEISHELHKHSTDVERSCHTDWDDIREQLKTLHKECRDKKEDNALMSGAIFANSGVGELKKRKADVALVNGIWLDIDNGELTPKAFEAIFPEIRWLMWNTFSNGDKGQLKYRVLMPTLVSVTVEQYPNIWDAIAERIKSFGYYVGSEMDYKKAIDMGRHMPKRSGLDVSKRTPNSFFYYPSQSGFGKKYSFWCENWSEHRKLLNPVEWLSYLPVEPAQYVSKAPYQNPRSAHLTRVLQAMKDANTKGAAVDEELVIARKQAETLKRRDMAIADFRAAPPHTGNQAFFTLASRLFNTGLFGHELRTILEIEARNARHPNERIAEIDGILKSLDAKFRRAA